MNTSAANYPDGKNIPVTSKGDASGKSREEIMAEREAKKLAKQAKKAKIVGGEVNTNSPKPPQSKMVNDTNVNSPVCQSEKTSSSISPNQSTEVVTSTAMNFSAEKTREQIKAEREAKKQSKQKAKAIKINEVSPTVPLLDEKMENMSISNNKSISQQGEEKAQSEHFEKKKPSLSKAERRALQEAQRAAKAEGLAQKSSAKASPVSKTTAQNVGKLKQSPTLVNTANTSAISSPSRPKLQNKVQVHGCKVKLFSHLENAHKDVSQFINNPHLHPSIARLGEQYTRRTVVGSNARCIAFLNALKMVIRDYETPPKKEFARSLETSIKYCVDHLHKCRPLAVSVSNAYKHIKQVLTQLPTDQAESELKLNLCHFIDVYIENQIGKAAQAISFSVQEKISDGDVILTFGCSSLINYICEEAQRRKVKFRVIVVDSRPYCEGQELLRRLVTKEIPCTYVLINAVSFVMAEATKVLLGAHALLSNGYVMSRTGTAQVALVARSFNVPVLVCCETHKFSERFQTDAIVSNELGNPDDLIPNNKCCLNNWQSTNKISPLNLLYDCTPPELVTAVVTEVSILPCTSVPVILRIKPTEIGYYN